jgi:tRNA G26 N,N-dimethylase Trm1
MALDRHRRREDVIDIDPLGGQLPVKQAAR